MIECPTNGAGMKKLWTAIFAALLVAPAYAQDDLETGTFLCIVEMATGFMVKNGKWEQVKFHSGRKYIVRPLREGDRLFIKDSATVQYGVFQFGQETDIPIAFSNYGFSFSEMEARGYLFDNFYMNRETLRFTTFYVGNWHLQYQSAEQEGGDTPVISIGSCGRL